MTDAVGEAACTCRRGTLAIGRAAYTIFTPQLPELWRLQWLAHKWPAQPLQPQVVGPALVWSRSHGRILFRERESKTQLPLRLVTLLGSMPRLASLQALATCQSPAHEAWAGPCILMAGHRPQTCLAYACTRSAVCFPANAACNRPRQNSCRLDWAAKGMPPSSHEHCMHFLPSDTWVLPSFRASQVLCSVCLVPMRISACRAGIRGHRKVAHQEAIMPCYMC